MPVVLPMRMSGTILGEVAMTEDILQKIADRAGELSAMTVRELRLTHSENIDGTVSGLQWQGVCKAKLISDILFDEFSEQD